MVLVAVLPVSVLKAFFAVLKASATVPVIVFRAFAFFRASNAVLAALKVVSITPFTVRTASPETIRAASHASEANAPTCSTLDLTVRTTSLPAMFAAVHASSIHFPALSTVANTFFVTEPSLKSLNAFCAAVKAFSPVFVICPLTYLTMLSLTPDAPLTKPLKIPVTVSHAPFPLVSFAPEIVFTIVPATLPTPFLKLL